MNGIWVDTGKVDSLNTYLTRLNTYGYLALYTNSFTPDHATTWAALTEAAWAGYARQQTTAWPAAALSGDYHAFSTHPVLLFPNTSGAPVTAYGWALITNVGGTITLIAVGNFTSPQTIANGDFLGWVPTVQDTSEF